MACPQGEVGREQADRFYGSVSQAPTVRSRPNSSCQPLEERKTNLQVGAAGYVVDMVPDVLSALLTAQNISFTVARTCRGSTGWICLSSTPPAGSPDRREA